MMACLPQEECAREIQTENCCYREMRFLNDLGKPDGTVPWSKLREYVNQAGNKDN